jgi:ABC-type antimicrobial peptide transport system ATPase subunit
MITRPCLCQHDRRKMTGSKIALFHQNMADACVNSVKEIVVLFPDNFSISRLSEASAWWQFLHYLIQAIVVLLIELKFWAKLRIAAPDELITPVEGALHSIWLLSEFDASALRAWRLCSELYRKIAEE